VAVGARAQVELQTVAAHERQDRNRASLLERIASLQEDEPYAGYDALSAGEVIERLREADEDARSLARDYEGRRRQRDEVLSATQPEIGKQ
jgi:hypothetical protein